MGTVGDLSELYCHTVEGDSDAVARLIAERALMIETAMTDEWFPIISANGG